MAVDANGVKTFETGRPSLHDSHRSEACDLVERVAGEEDVVGRKGCGGERGRRGNRRRKSRR